jgi:primosomal protein N' (replication factor Y) (superfamily II helicase)
MSSAGSAPTDATRAAIFPLIPAWRVDRAFDYAIPGRFRDVVRVGSLVRVPFGGRRVRGIVARVFEGEPDELEEIASIVFDDPLTPPPLDRLMTWVAERYLVPRGRALMRVVPPRVRVGAEPPLPVQPGAEPVLLPTYEGGRSLLSAVRSGRGGAWLVRTTEAANRTALVCDLVAAAVAAQRGAALVAVPEIRYGSSVIEAVMDRFPEGVRVDSGVPERDRTRGWLSLARGHRVGVGGRATVFAPAPDLRLIVLDEEHHPTYKEDRAPRYDARRVALERARLQGSVCVFLSSAPSVETGASALGGELGWVEPGREERRQARPIIELVTPPEDRALSHQLHERIRDTLRAGGRAALLAPARGYSRALWCAQCRRSLRCPVCEAGLFYDRSPRRVRCARCGFASAAPDRCPSCASVGFLYVGAGSERLAEQLAKSFPRTKVVRMDPAALEAWDEEDRRASTEDADLYVTTWVGTKASLRPDVSLVGVLDADWMIRRPDFRAAERAHQALTEMAGWAGPAGSGGRLVVQTREPGHHSIQALVRGDYRFFLERELELRRELSYPPYSELVKASAFGPRAGKLLEQVGGAASPRGGRVLGPVPVLVAGERGRQLLIKCPDALEVARALRGILPAVPAGSRLRIDVDPA